MAFALSLALLDKMAEAAGTPEAKAEMYRAVIVHQFDQQAGKVTKVNPAGQVIHLTPPAPQPQVNTDQIYFSGSTEWTILRNQFHATVPTRTTAGDCRAFRKISKGVEAFYVSNGYLSTARLWRVGQIMTLRYPQGHYPNNRRNREGVWLTPNEYFQVLAKQP